VVERLRVSAVSGMHPENPAVKEFCRFLHVVPTTATAMGMGHAIPRMAALAVRLASGERIGPADEEGYLARGFRRNALAAENGAQRAVRMMLRKMRGEPYRTETPLPSFDRVEPARPLADLSQATIAIVTEGGVVPQGNPDKLEARLWGRRGKPGPSLAGGKTGLDCRERTLRQEGLCAAYALGRVPARTDQAPLGRSSEKRPLSPKRVQSRHRLSVHSLRHTFATLLYRKSGDLLLLNRALGHRDIRTTSGTSTSRTAASSAR